MKNNFLKTEALAALSYVYRLHFLHIRIQQTILLGNALIIYKKQKKNDLKKSSERFSSNLQYCTKFKCVLIFLFFI